MRNYLFSILFFGCLVILYLTNPPLLIHQKVFEERVRLYVLNKQKSIYFKGQSGILYDSLDYKDSCYNVSLEKSNKLLNQLQYKRNDFIFFSYMSIKYSRDSIYKDVTMGLLNKIYITNKELREGKY